MNVAISGDRSQCVTRRLAPGTYLFAVANGFGFVEGEPIARNVLQRLQEEMLRRIRRRKQVKTALHSAFARVNDEVHARTASHEDFTSAACSATAVLLIDKRAYLAHVGSTAAYLCRDGYVVSLTQNDRFENALGVPVLTRALGIAASTELTRCSFALNEGDTLVLAGSRLREPDERRRLAEALAEGEPNAFAHGNLLTVRFQPEERQEEPRVETSQQKLSGVAVGVLATMLFYAMLCIR